MSSLKNSNFVVTDIETTGSNTELNRLTEVACVAVRNSEFVAEYSSLVNPHQFIPPFIQNMTGITNQMAFAAPDAEIILPKFRQMFNLPELVFVAHNANFDFNFLNANFRRYNLEEINSPVLCTLKLAKKLLPNNRKKNLGSLATFFGIRVNGRHRAFGDAEATAYIMMEFFDLLENEHGITTTEEILEFQNKKIGVYKPVPAVVKRLESKLAIIPNTPGVYYFKSKYDNILYIGKAKSLKERVSSYFHAGTSHSKKVNDLLKKTHKLDWEMTNSELEALILESKEIKLHKPQYNVMLKMYRHYPFIKLTVNEDFPRVEKCYEILDDGAEYFGPFRSSYFVDEVIQTIEKKYKLRKCNDDLKPSPNKSPCLYHYINLCNAPCNANQSKEDYQNEVESVKFYLSGFGHGIIEQLENQMNGFSDRMEFETAAQMRNRINELKVILNRDGVTYSSINQNNLILTLPQNAREKTIELYFFKYGKLLKHSIVGRLSPLLSTYDDIHEFFYNGSNGTSKLNIEDIDEIKIVSSWIYKHRKNATIIYTSSKTEEEVRSEITDAIRNANFIEEYNS